MPRLKKITIDAGNGRVIESVDVPRIAKKPVFYAGETTSVDVNAVELVGNGDGTAVYNEIRSAGGNVVNMRLGTTTTLVAQGTDFVFTPPARYQATLSFTTAPAVQVPLTVQVVTVPTAAPTFDVFNFYPATVTVNTFIGSVTALFRATLQTGLQPAVTVAVPIEEIDAFRYPGLEIFVAGSSVTFGATLNTTATATFTVTTSADTVSAIAIANAGSGYPDGTYNLTVAGGTVTTAATAQAVASGGAIISVSITQNGSGYVTAPAATLFRPAKSLLSVSPSQIVAVVDGRPRFYWHTPSGNATAVTLSFSAPDSTGTPPPATAPLVRIEHLGPDSSGIPLWEVRVVSAGYGYSSTPTVTVPPVPVSARRRTTVATVSGSNLLVNTTYDNSSTPSPRTVPSSPARIPIIWPSAAAFFAVVWETLSRPTPAVPWEPICAPEPIRWCSAETPPWAPLRWSLFPWPGGSWAAAPGRLATAPARAWSPWPTIPVSSAPVNFTNWPAAA